MLVCPVNKSLVNFRENHNNLAFLIVGNGVIEDDLLIKLLPR